MPNARKRRLLVVSRDLALLRGHYDDVIAALDRAGVSVRIRYVNDGALSADSYKADLARRESTVEVEQLPRIESDAGELLALRLRQLANLLRFYHRDYRGREWLREVKFARAAAGPRRWARRFGYLGSRASLLAIRVVASVDRVLPAARPAQALLAEERPDAVVAVPVIRTPQFVDYLKAAAAQGIPTISWIQSWDNLSSKGLLHFVPDRVFVWNEVQRAELARYHHIPESRVCITGAQTFDHWFSDERPLDRREWCAGKGFDPEEPIILYLVSSRQIEPSPAAFFLRWLGAIRSSGIPALETASVLVRPHPTEVGPWRGLEQQHPRLAVSPSTDEALINSPLFRSRYRNELHHCSVAVALNTSGMIDAAIFGKPVCTAELPEFAFGQRGTVHFEYLTTSNGPLRTAGTLQEHVAVLARLVERDPYELDERSMSFVRTFVRPFGTEVSGAAVFSEEMLRLLEAPSGVRTPGPTGRAVGRLLGRVAPVLGMPLEAQPFERRRRKSVKRLRKTQKSLKRWLHHRRKAVDSRRKKARAQGVAAGRRIGGSRRPLQMLRRRLVISLTTDVKAARRR